MALTHGVALTPVTVAPLHGLGGVIATQPATGTAGPHRRGVVGAMPQSAGCTSLLLAAAAAAAGGACRHAWRAAAGRNRLSLTAARMTSRRPQDAGVRERCRVVACRAIPPEDRGRIKDQLQLLQNVPVMNELPDDAMLSIMDGMVRHELAEGESLFHQGDSPDAMFLLDSGELAEWRVLTEKDDQVRQVRTFTSGSVGSLALLYDQPRAATVTATEHTVLWRLSRSHFMHVLSNLSDEAEAAEMEDSDEECDINFDETPRKIFVVSDGTGDTGTNALGLALKQFDICYGASPYEMTTFQYVRRKEEILEITRRAREEGALVVYTLMRAEARNAMREEVTRDLEPGEGTLKSVDLWEPMLVQLEGLLGSKRTAPVSAVARRPVCDTCIEMLDAIEYTRKLDDGVLPHLWSEADVILIGLSRAGKTPLAFYLAQRGFKVANYPVVPEEEPPKELFDPELQAKCIALSISPQRLQNVRNERMKEFGRGSSEYASAANCSKEVSWLKTFYMKRGPRWPVVDVTNGSVEESAAKILRILDRSKQPQGGKGGKILSPSVV